MKRYWILLVAVVPFCAGCLGGPERKVTADEEKKWRHPPKEAPAEYTGNMFKPPTGPPPDAAQPPNAGQPPNADGNGN